MSKLPKFDCDCYLYCDTKFTLNTSNYFLVGFYLTIIECFTLNILSFFFSCERKSTHDTILSEYLQTLKKYHLLYDSDLYKDIISAL